MNSVKLLMLQMMCFLAAINQTLDCAERTADLLSGVKTNLTMEMKLLKRRKRYLAFPDGSSCAATICLTIGVIGNPNVNWLSWAVNWGVTYTLPNYKWVREHVNGFGNKTKAEAQRRSRRSLYELMHSAIEHYGHNGWDCIARAICESSKHLNGAPGEPHQRGNMLEEIVRLIFSLPDESVQAHEPEKHHHYDYIYRRSKQEDHDCILAYPDCHFSLLALIMNKYAPAAPAQLKKYRFM